MKNILSFANWMEFQLNQPTADPHQTIIGNSQISTGNINQSSTGLSPQTIRSNIPPIHSDIIQSAEGLKSIHNQLRNIFAKARERASSFRHPRIKLAFDRELLSGIDGVGRAHAIIQPTATGAESDTE